MTALRTIAIEKQFGGTPVLQHIHLQLDAGQRLALVGRSGAGKSTLLRVIAGLERPDAGSLWLAGQEATHQPPAERGLALVSQDYALYPQLNVQQNLETALRPLRLDRQERQSRIADALAQLGLTPYAQRLPAQLSGGQAQRVALAKAVVRRPRLLLLDEPLSQVDALLREDLRELILHVTEVYHMTLVIVTHEASDAMRLATQLALLDEGQIVQHGPPVSVYEQPSCRLSAELLSTFGMNWLPSAHARDWLTGSPTAAAWTQLLGAEPHVGFRPEAASIAAPAETDCSGDDAEPLRLRGTLQRVQPLGFATLATVRVGAHAIRCLHGPPTRLDTTVDVIIPRQRLLMFSS